ncbi:NPQTN class sortase B protein-sorting domain-containing protein, partial [Staphylococcus haemolyticus]
TGTGGVENPQTSAGIPGYIYIVPAVALMSFVFITFYAKKVNKGNVK